MHELGFRPFIPPRFLQHPDAMTLFPKLTPRRGLLRGVPGERRLFRISPDVGLSSIVHWQPERRQADTLLLLHGLEGCADSHYMRGLAHKAWHAGLNVVRLNQRTCGDSERDSDTFYHGALIDDVWRVLRILAREDGLQSVWLAGYSMGGNLLLRLAGERADDLDGVRGVAAVCPNIDPSAAVAALQQPRNRIYHDHFLRLLKARLLRKAVLEPHRYDVRDLPAIRTMRAFDDRYTGPLGGFRDAAEYYERSAARHVVHRIRIPTLILTAQDDPFIPYATFIECDVSANPAIQFVAPRYGGHCGFIQRRQPDEDTYWAENRVVQWISDASRRPPTAGLPARRLAESVQCR
jgi:predicted alpha/beta-fold hydrolase